MLLASESEVVQYVVTVDGKPVSKKFTSEGEAIAFMSTLAENVSAKIVQVNQEGNQLLLG
jgi:hypothetical protein